MHNQITTPFTPYIMITHSTEITPSAPSAITPLAIYEKYQNGDPITDEELRIGYDHFNQMHELLRKSGERFAFAAWEAYAVADKFNKYHRERTGKFYL